MLEKIADTPRAVPLIINDRLNIAPDCGADGLQIGQADFPLVQTRKLLGGNKLIGLSVSAVEKAAAGEWERADYLGAGAVFATGSKADAGDPLGIVISPILGYDDITQAVLEYRGFKWEK